jgi:hypothetical protein
MYRIDSSDTTDKLPVPTPPGTNPNSYFRKPDAIRGIKGTILPAEWMNSMQEELCNAIAGAGLTLDKADRHQLSKIIGVKNVSFVATQLGSAQLFSPMTATKVKFNTKIFDTNNNYDAANHFRFTPKIAGTYLVGARCISTFSSHEINSLILDIMKNGTMHISHEVWANPLGSVFSYPSGNTLVQMNGTTDYIEVYLTSYFRQMVSLIGGFSFFFATKVN